MVLGNGESGTEGKLLLLAREDGMLEGRTVRSKTKVSFLNLFFVVEILCSGVA